MPRIVDSKIAETFRWIGLLPPDAPGQPLAVASTVSDGVKISLILSTAAGLLQKSLRVARFLREDVNYAVYRVGAPHRRARPANDFDAFHILQHHILLIPIHSAKDAVVNYP